MFSKAHKTQVVTKNIPPHGPLFSEFNAPKEFPAPAPTHAPVPMPNYQAPVVGGSASMADIMSNPMVEMMMSTMVALTMMSQQNLLG